MPVRQIWPSSARCEDGLLQSRIRILPVSRRETRELPVIRDPPPIAASANLFVLEKPFFSSKMLIDESRIPSRHLSQLIAHPGHQFRVKNSDRRIARKKASPREVAEILHLLRQILEITERRFLMQPYQDGIRRA